ncbi:tonB dependent receptor domain-containing protein [Ditylenchus destructor]|nr:tonB dependent receptor domain-containing protein [Ditylenchus destructor]
MLGRSHGIVVLTVALACAGRDPARAPVALNVAPPEFVEAAELLGYPAGGSCCGRSCPTSPRAAGAPGRDADFGRPGPSPRRWCWWPSLRWAPTCWPRARAAPPPASRSAEMSVLIAPNRDIDPARSALDADRADHTRPVGAGDHVDHTGHVDDAIDGRSSSASGLAGARYWRSTACAWRCPRAPTSCPTSRCACIRDACWDWSASPAPARAPSRWRCWATPATARALPPAVCASARSTCWTSRLTRCAKCAAASSATWRGPPAAALNPLRRIGTQLREVLEIHEPALVAADRGERVRQTLADVGLPVEDEFLRRFPHQLSGGQQQRVLLALAFITRPRLIVMDEPTPALDVTTQAKVLETVRALCRRQGVAAVYVSHDLAVVRHLADEVLVLYAGRVVEQAPLRALFESPRHPYTQGLLAAIPDRAEPITISRVPDAASPAAGGLAHAGAGRLSRAGGRIRIGQDHACARPGRHRRAGRRRGALRRAAARPEGETSSGRSAPAGPVHLPEPVPLAQSAPHGRRDAVHRRAPLLRHRRRRRAPSRGRRAGPGRPARLRRAGLSTRAVRRPAPARGHRPRADLRAAAADLRRDHLRARRPPGQSTILDLLARLQRGGLALLFVTHDLGVVRAVARRVAVLRHGVLVEHGPVEQVLDAPIEPYTPPTGHRFAVADRRHPPVAAAAPLPLLHLTSRNLPHDRLHRHPSRRRRIRRFRGLLRRRGIARQGAPPRLESEAIEAARHAAAAIAEISADPTQNARLPLRQAEILSQSGVTAISLPKELGGLGASVKTVVETVRLISTADGGVGQLLQIHNVMPRGIATGFAPEIRDRLVADILDGKRFGTPRWPSDGRLILRGSKFYSTGSYLAEWISLSAGSTEGPINILLHRDTPGLTLVDDWHAFGQQHSEKGPTVRFDGIVVDERFVPRRPPARRHAAHRPDLAADPARGHRHRKTRAARWTRRSITCATTRGPGWTRRSSTPRRSRTSSRPSGKNAVAVRAAEALLGARRGALRRAPRRPGQQDAAGRADPGGGRRAGPVGRGLAADLERHVLAAGCQRQPDQVEPRSLLARCPRAHHARPDPLAPASRRQLLPQRRRSGRVRRRLARAPAERRRQQPLVPPAASPSPARRRARPRRPTAASPPRSPRARRWGGLSPDQVLVLVNGKRRHVGANFTRQALAGGRGAAAGRPEPHSRQRHRARGDPARRGRRQYGSDAIAGVINIVLRAADSGGNRPPAGAAWPTTTPRGRAARDQRLEGSGASERGFPDVAFDAGEKGKANNTRPDPSLPEGHPFKHWAFGSPAVKDQLKPPGANAELPPGALTRSTPSAPTAIAAAPGENFYESNTASPGLARSAAFQQRFPNGRVPINIYELDDAALNVGVRHGDAREGQGTWPSTWAPGTRYGVNSPSTIYTGSRENTQANATLDYSRDLRVPVFSGPVTVAAGLAYRWERYVLEAGDPIAYTRGPFYNPSSVLGVGVPGLYSGITDQDARPPSRKGYGGYLSAEGDVLAGLNVGVALGSEHYSDFGGTTNGKLSLRYALTPQLAVRGTASNGYRAPSIVQLGYSAFSVQTATIKGPAGGRAAAHAAAGQPHRQPDRRHGAATREIAQRLAGPAPLFFTNIRTRVREARSSPASTPGACGIEAGPQRRLGVEQKPHHPRARRDDLHRRSHSGRPDQGPQHPRADRGDHAQGQAGAGRGLAGRRLDGARGRTPLRQVAKNRATNALDDLTSPAQWVVDAEVAYRFAGPLRGLTLAAGAINLFDSYPRENPTVVPQPRGFPPGSGRSPSTASTRRRRPGHENSTPACPTVLNPGVPSMTSIHRVITRLFRAASSGLLASLGAILLVPGAQGRPAAPLAQTFAPKPDPSQGEGPGLRLLPLDRGHPRHARPRAAQRAFADAVPRPTRAASCASSTPPPAASTARRRSSSPARSSSQGHAARRGGAPGWQGGHGTVGLADICAPSWAGRSYRDVRYLSRWLKEGFAIVASDYEGLGVPGPHPLINVPMLAYDILDSARAVIHDVPGLANRVLLVGQSQGGIGVFAAASYQTRYAPATPIPLQRDPNKVDDSLAYGFYGFLVDQQHDPSLKPEDVFTEQGQALVAQGRVACLSTLASDVVGNGLTIGNARLATPTPAYQRYQAGASERSARYSEYPTLAIPHPVFIGTGADDVTPSAISQLALMRDACAPRDGGRGASVRGPRGPSATVNASLKDSVPFARGKGINDQPVAPVCAPRCNKGNHHTHGDRQPGFDLDYLRFHAPAHEQAGFDRVLIASGPGSADSLQSPPTSRSTPSGWASWSRIAPVWWRPRWRRAASPRWTTSAAAGGCACMRSPASPPSLRKATRWSTSPSATPAPPSTCRSCARPGPRPSPSALRGATSASRTRSRRSSRCDPAPSRSLSAARRTRPRGVGVRHADLYAIWGEPLADEKAADRPHPRQRRGGRPARAPHQPVGAAHPGRHRGVGLEARAGDPGQDPAEPGVPAGRPPSWPAEGRRLGTSAGRRPRAAIGTTARCGCPRRPRWAPTATPPRWWARPRPWRKPCWTTSTSASPPS